MPAGSKTVLVTPFSRAMGREYASDDDGNVYIAVESAIAVRKMTSQSSAILDTSTTASGGGEQTIIAAQGATTKIVVHGLYLFNRADDDQKFKIFFDESTDQVIVNNTFPSKLPVNWNFVNGLPVSASVNKALKVDVPNDADFDLAIIWDKV